MKGSFADEPVPKPLESFDCSFEIGANSFPGGIPYQLHLPSIVVPERSPPPQARNDEERDLSEPVYQVQSLKWGIA